jgi:hypothetical protein
MVEIFLASPKISQPITRIPLPLGGGRDGYLGIKTLWVKDNYV